MKGISHAKNNLALKNMSEKFFVVEDMNLETAEGNLAMNSGEEIHVGSDDNENLVIREVNKLFVVDDRNVAEAVLNNIICAEEMAGVSYRPMSIEEAAKSGCSNKDICKSVIDDLKGEYDAPVVTCKTKLENSVKAKKISENKIHGRGSLVIEAVEIFESEATDMPLQAFRMFKEEDNREEYDNEADFVNAVKNLGGNAEADGEGNLLGKLDVKFIGKFDKNIPAGTVFTNNDFETEVDMDAALANEPEKVSVVPELDWEGRIDDENLEVANNALETLENSPRENADFESCKESLVKAGLTDEEAKIMCSAF